MGNVSYTVPSIHPMYSIPAKSGNHTPGTGNFKEFYLCKEFTACTGSNEAHERTWVASKAMAMTAFDLFANPEYIKQVNFIYLGYIKASEKFKSSTQS